MVYKFFYCGTLQPQFNKLGLGRTVRSAELVRLSSRRSHDEAAHEKFINQAPSLKRDKITLTNYILIVKIGLLPKFGNFILCSCAHSSLPRLCFGGRVAVNSRFDWRDVYLK